MGDAAANAVRTLNVNVGILGHVDSGKTSLSRALSTTGSTAAFDKNPQSKERGITLDLGFSSFITDLPEQFADQPYDRMQVTLVDCPGHASLIKTIIGGAQIIDLMLLVIDLGKGIQTQTAECLVIGEILNDKLIVVLNKLDTLPADSREEKLAKMQTRIQKTLAATKFVDAPLVPVAARPGGADGSGGGAALDLPPSAPLGVALLIETIKRNLSLPKRTADGPLHFAIDHCFPIKGQGTVLTGTVLSGAMKIGQEIEFPELKQARKIKSMQMFKKPVNSAQQGDRLGVCVTQLDAKALERGIACTPGYIVTVDIALMAVRHIRFFKAVCKTKVKFHVTVGHTTVMGTATFFGKRAPSLDPTADDKAIKAAQALRQLELARQPLPEAFDADAQYEYQDELDPQSNEQWAVVQLEAPIACALPATAIGSHLDTDINVNTCRLAFHGKLLRSLTKSQLRELKIFKHKKKEGQVERVADENTLICKNLFKQGTDMTQFFGMQVQLGSEGPLGYIDSTFGKSKFKCVFRDPGPNGLAEACKGEKLFLNYKRFVFDETKKMIQS